jgi:DNA-binding transcriptional ArsR family regulator
MQQGDTMEEKYKITWDKGGAYDLFVSLMVLHWPNEFGLRPSWAAGVRSRLPMSLRAVLEHSQNFMNIPLTWIYALPEPKDAQAALTALKALKPEELLPALTFYSKNDEATNAYRDLLLSIDGKQRLTANLESAILEDHWHIQASEKTYARAVFEAWSQRKTFGEKFTQALEAYVENFFQEDEPRIIPAQEKALAKIQEQAQQKDILALLEEISTGVRLDWIENRSKLILAPSFWGAPFVFFDRIDENSGFILFGARPKGTTLVPGELIPEELLNSLKALANSTRLKILRYMLEGPCTPSELARILRLRPPTVIHHLQNLRLAGLVRVTVSPKAERRYELRRDGIETTIQDLQAFFPGE